MEARHSYKLLACSELMNLSPNNLSDQQPKRFNISLLSAKPLGRVYGTIDLNSDTANFLVQQFVSLVVCWFMRKATELPFSSYTIL